MSPQPPPQKKGNNIIQKSNAKALRAATAAQLEVQDDEPEMRNTMNVKTSTEQPMPVPLSTLNEMSELDLKALLQAIKERLRLARLMNTDNINVMSVRLSLDTCNKVRRLAFDRHTTISDITRHAIDAYCKREKAR